jgi:hypothetical protein
MKRNTLVGMILLVLVLASGIVVLAKSRAANSRTQLLRDAVLTTLGVEGGTVGTRECYMDGKAKQCTSIRYSISKEKCLELTKGQQPEETTSDYECGPVQKRVERSEKTIYLTIGDGPERGTYQVEAWL